MFANCSTRDGRSRVRAPSAPHLTWVAHPVTFSSGVLGGSAVATDNSGNAYVVIAGANDATVASVERTRVDDGSVAWTSPIAPDMSTTMPVVLPSGRVDLLALTANRQDALFTFDTKSGAATTATFGFDLNGAQAALAVGVDGSLFFAHSDGAGTYSPTHVISRVAVDGSVSWTSVDLSTLGPPPVDRVDVHPSTLALAKDDLVIVVISTVTSSGPGAVASAFDGATGALRWFTPLQGQPVGGPALRSDGSIVTLLEDGGVSDLVDFDPANGAAAIHPLAIPVINLQAITEDGVVIAGADAPGAGFELVALARDGTVLWTYASAASSFGATIAEDGTIVTFGKHLAALDPGTGTPRWELAGPPPDPCIFDMALTSMGGIVALGCYGTLFGASD